jgi:hypothetical protein
LCAYGISAGGEAVKKSVRNLGGFHMKKQFDGEFEGLEIVSSSKAKAQGMRALTTPIHVVCEVPILRSIIADMRRGGIRFALVGKGEGGECVEVWRGVAAGKGKRSGIADNL